MRHLLIDLLHRHPIRPECGRLGLDFSLQPSHAYFEKLIEIATDNTQETQAVEQRRRGILRLRQHATVKRQLAEFPVEKQLRRQN